MAIFKINNVEVTKEEFYTTCFSSAPSSFTATISTPLTHITTINMSEDNKETRQEKIKEGFEKYSEGHSTRHKAAKFAKQDVTKCGELSPMTMSEAVKNVNELATAYYESVSKKIENLDLFSGQKITPKANEQERKILAEWEANPEDYKYLLDGATKQSEEWKSFDEFFSKGKKESNGKLFYEFDWEFIEAAAKRMQANKGKYKPFNWTKKIDVTELLQALNRHHIEVMKGNYDDGEEELGHILSYFCNAMMIWHQLKNHK